MRWTAGKAPDFWQTRFLPAMLLLPLAGLFGILSWVRRTLYRSGLVRAAPVPVSVIVVGNICVGGSGKTPVVAWLVERLRETGFRPGIVSRGYGGKSSGAALVVPDADPAIFGDEPVLLARLTRCPVVVGADRPAAVLSLLQAHPECNVIVSDDGLQHYRLRRDVEVVVVDERALGNRWLLPAGPLREGLWRLRSADVIVAHGDLSSHVREHLGAVPVASMTLEGDRLVSLGMPSETRALSDFAGMRVHAVAGIGHPERFFDQLGAMGLDIVPHAFPDHHRFSADDLAFAPGEPKILTAKDAVKCRAFAPADTWEFPVTAQIEPIALERILEKLSHGRQAA
ncbi:MAG TPA: tetraacyldisaccharide 4'-kinase [Rhodocyclaceae bacterium]|nr:tetraacyldisaccharide 4'-kinase [Rhodocyclaceae bacterium]